jgi:hypothetical protein
MLFVPLLHQALIVLGDGELALLLAVAGTMGVGEDGRRRHKKFRFLERLDVQEVYAMARATEVPHRHVLRARRQFCRGVGAEGEPVATGAKLCVECTIRARPDASETGPSAAVRRHPSEKAKQVALARGEEEAAGIGAWRRRNFLMVGVRALRQPI